MLVLEEQYLIPSGCQIKKGRTIDADYDGKYFAICSSLAIYLYNRNTLKLVKIISGGFSKRIIAIAWSKFNTKSFVTCSNDRLLVWWDLSLENPRNTLQLNKQPFALESNPHDPDKVFLGIDNGSIVMCSLADQCEIKFTDLYKHSKSKTLALRPQKNDYNIATSYESGLVIIYNYIKKKETKIKPPKNAITVTDIQWDPLSKLYIIIAYKNGTMCLWDIETNDTVFRFDLDGLGASNLLWIPSKPGSFITSNSRSGIVRMWNVSRKNSILPLRISDYGILNILLLPKSNKILCTFSDGSSSIYCLDSEQTEWSNKPGHSEAIFDAQFQRYSPYQLATCSFDSTTRIWNTDTGECDLTLNGQDGVIYSVSWSPSKLSSNQIATASSLGSIFIWDTESGESLMQLHVHTGSIFKLCWNELGIISTSTDKNIKIINSLDGTVLKTIKMDCGTFGCSWNPFRSNIFAIGCADCSVIVYDVSKEIKYTLEGHKEQVFHVSWSPLLLNIMASGSNDYTIRIWKFEYEKSKVLSTLKGHHDRVRAIIWSQESPNILLSGSWDKTIRVWSVFDGTCLHVATEHMGDVYGLAVHPNKPFNFVSTSRDSTMRFWYLNYQCSQISLIRLLLYGNKKYLNLKDSIADKVSCKMDDILLSKNDESKLYSPMSWNFLNLNDECSIGYYYSTVFEYFVSIKGIKDFWILLESSISNSDNHEYRQLTTFNRMGTAPTRQNTLNRIETHKMLHASEIVRLSQTEAQKFASIRRKFTTFTRGRIIPNSTKNKEALELSAIQHLKCGNIEKYCEIMKSLNKWNEALIVSPAVSIKYWHSLLEEYTESLQMNCRSLPYMIASNKIDKAVKFCTDSNQLQDAFLIAKINFDGCFDRLESNLRRKEKSSPKKKSSKEKIRLLNKVQGSISDIYFKKGEPVLAACAFLSIDNYTSAINTLCKGHQIELAFAITQCVSCIVNDYILFALMKKCEKYYCYELAFEFIKLMKNPIVEASLLCIRIENNEAKKWLRTMTNELHEISYIDKAKKHAEKKETLDTIRCYLLGNQMENAAIHSLNSIKECLLSKSGWNLKQLDSIGRLMENIDGKKLNRYLLNELLVYMAFIGMNRAIWKEYPVYIISYSLELILKEVQSNSSFDFVIPLDYLMFQELVYLYYHDHDMCFPKIETILNYPKLDQNIKNLVLDMKSNLLFTKESSVYMNLSTSNNEIILTGNTLPSIHENVKVSLLSFKPITSPYMILEDKTSYINMNEAIMWANINSFSPLNSGKKINPY